MENLILKGPPLRAPKIDKGIGEYFFEQAEKYGDKPFQIDGDNGNIESFLFVRQKSTRVAIRLKKMGIKPKDIVLMCCRNNTDNIIPALAGWYLGAYIASIDPRQSIADIKHLVGLVEPKVIFVIEDALSLVEQSLNDSPLNPKIIVIGDSEKYEKMYDMQTETKEVENFKPVRQRGSDIAGIIFSSGTTSAPKGIYLSNSYVLNCSSVVSEHGHSKPTVSLHFSTLYWVSGWTITGMCIATGIPKVIAHGITGEKFLQLVDKYKITYTLASNVFTYEITNLPDEVIKKYDTSSLHNICLAGATMDSQQILKLRKLLPHTYVALGYGSTEGNVIACHNFTNLKAYEEKVLSSGTVTPEMQIKFVDLETETLLGPNKEGEIRVKTPFLMSGYHKLKNSENFDEDGFFKTGDAGYYDDDQYIYVTDRIGETFKYRLDHLSPTLLEHTLLGHPDIAEAVAFGVPHPVDRNHPGACVVLKKGTSPTVEELLDFVNSKVSDSYKLRAGLMLVDSIQKTPTGKIERRTVRDLFVKSNQNK